MNGRQVCLRLTIPCAVALLKYMCVQIKNAVSSAQSIALDAQETLSVAHINKVLDVISDWRAAHMHAQLYREGNNNVSYPMQHSGELLIDDF